MEGTHPRDEEGFMTADRRTTSSRWAPWWIYVIVAIAGNQVKQQLVPDDTPLALMVLITAATVAALLALVTSIYRAMASPHDRGPNRSGSARPSA
jgi:hypothetical protein